MADIIHLLPDNIANQIAAGEVIQRPASAVKEMLENAVDAGADDIQLIIGDAGKSLVQVIDNGKGMSLTDARMCFERHATSKIAGIDDLFSIRTMGFRGEALASIAAVSQVELRTRREEDALGTCIEIENSMVIRQDPCACVKGTSMAMKNLFFSVPARRNFLRSNAVEMRHIIDEFMHVALAFPHIRFQLTHNGQEIYQLPKGSYKQRIVQALGNTYNAKLVAVKEETDYLAIHGFVGKPDAARKTRGDQYLFVNSRYIRSSYLNHAVMSAFQGLLGEQTFPLYVLYIDINPSQIDINVHPTKQEIKFDDERLVYAFVQAAVKHALAQYSISPSLEFDLDPGIQQLDAVSKPITVQDRQQAESGGLFQSFAKHHQAHKIEPSGNLSAWRSFFETPTANTALNEVTHTQERLQIPDENKPSDSLKDRIHGFEQDHPLQIRSSFIIVKSRDGLMIINQQLAHERILYERYLDAMAGNPIATQQSLFPQQVTLHPGDAELMQELIPELNLLGYKIKPEGNHSFLLEGSPADGSGNPSEDIESVLESYKHFNPDLSLGKKEKLLRSQSSRRSIKSGKKLSEEEMKLLITDLCACSQAGISPSGLPTFVELSSHQLDSLFFR